jgi:predicted nucleic acid-binding protein
MTVEQCYVDSSALRQLYVHEAHSAAMAAWRFKHPGPLAITRFGRMELINSMSSAVFRGDIPHAVFQAFSHVLTSEFTDDRLRLVDLGWRAMLDRAADLSREHTPRIGTRSLDVLHVASALELKARQFVTYDERQARLARTCGLKIIEP